MIPTPKGEPLDGGRLMPSPAVRRVGQAPIPTVHGTFEAVAYAVDDVDRPEHLALVLGDVAQQAGVLVRVHSECLTGDLFGSLRCDCGPQLHDALETIGEEGRGVIVYLRGQEGRGIGLAHKLRAYRLQDEGRDTVEANLDLGLPADAREYGVAAAIISDLGIRSVRLLTNNPDKIDALRADTVIVDERIPLETRPNRYNQRYLSTKREKMGHWLDLARGARSTTASRPTPTNGSAAVFDPEPVHDDTAWLDDPEALDLADGIGVLPLAPDGSAGHDLHGESER